MKATSLAHQIVTFFGYRVFNEIPKIRIESLYMISLLDKIETQIYQEERSIQTQENVIAFKARKRSPKAMC